MLSSPNVKDVETPITFSDNYGFNGLQRKLIEAWFGLISLLV